MIAYTTNYQIFNDLKKTLKELIPFKLETKELGQHDGAIVFLFSFDTWADIQIIINVDSSFKVPIIIAHEYHSINLPITFTVIHAEDILEIAETISNMFIPSQYQNDIIHQDTKSQQTVKDIINTIKQ
jgi:hypothetical protein